MYCLFVHIRFTSNTATTKQQHIFTIMFSINYIQRMKFTKNFNNFTYVTEYQRISTQYPTKTVLERPTTYWPAVQVYTHFTLTNITFHKLSENTLDPRSRDTIRQISTLIRLAQIRNNSIFSRLYLFWKIAKSRSRVHGKIVRSNVGETRRPRSM